MTGLSWQGYAWWSDALAVANAAAQVTGRRRRVRRLPNGWWLVTEVDA